MNDDMITVSGNLIADPERRRTRGGHPMLTFRVASNHRYFNNRTGQWEEGGTNYYDVVAYRQLAVNAADSLEKGMGVHLQGHLRQRRFTRQDGSPGMSCEIEAKALGVDLTFVVAKVWRRPKPEGNDPWAVDTRTGEIREEPPGERAPGAPDGVAGEGSGEAGTEGSGGLIDPETTAYSVARDHEAEESYPALDGPPDDDADSAGQDRTDEDGADQAADERVVAPVG